MILIRGGFELEKDLKIVGFELWEEFNWRGFN